jgi:hypothetical protein
MEHVPDMNHFGPDLQIDADISVPLSLGIPICYCCQQLVTRRHADPP